jgi:hypothetical protein
MVIKMKCVESYKYNHELYSVLCCEVGAKWKCAGGSY